MAEEDYARCHYSITCATDDIAIVHCLRALCELANPDIPKQIGWGGTKRADWIRDGKQITLRFTSPGNRDRFVREAQRILPVALWREARRNDNDPATRQRAIRE
ncbi:MAG TPA: hypothetical protein VFE58_18990 [Tepidisphaeraceae bacterium]|jgi:hypothetical protein|nr:hypothetical protein [Tepidisphaeraceae bacterium]